MKTKEQVISSLKKALEELDITSSLRLPIIQTIEYLQEEPVSDTQSPVVFYGLTGSVGNTKEEPQVIESAEIQHDTKTCKENDDSLTQEQNLSNVERIGKNWKVSVTDDLEAAIDTYLATYFGGEKEKQDWPFLKKMAIHFANWQKQQMMANAVDAVVKIDAGGYPYVDRTIELYDYDKDIPLAKRGDKVKILVIRKA